MTATSQDSNRCCKFGNLSRLNRQSKHGRLRARGIARGPYEVRFITQLRPFDPFGTIIRTLCCALVYNAEYGRCGSLHHFHGSVVSCPAQDSRYVPLHL